MLTKIKELVMANMEQMHQGMTSVDPMKDPMNKLKIPNGVAQQGVQTYDQMKEKEQMKQEIVDQLKNNINTQTI
jgi:hypothetical protein